MHLDFTSSIIHAGALVGYITIFLIIFAESGILVGFFLPGDSLLFSLGIAATQGFPNIWLLILIGCLAAILGDSVGYAFGKTAGHTLFTRNDSRFFKKAYLKRAHTLVEEYGKKAIIIARFTPFVRTFVPVVAGIGEMDYPSFLSFNVIGGIAWIISISLLGYFLGKVIPNIDRYILPIIGLIIVVSVIPPIREYLKHHKQSTDS